MLSVNVTQPHANGKTSIWLMLYTKHLWSRWKKVKKKWNLKKHKIKTSHKPEAPRSQTPKLLFTPLLKKVQYVSIGHIGILIYF